MFRCLKLNESTDTCVPDHFKIFIQNVLEEKRYLEQKHKDLFQSLKLDLQLIYCVALTVALELGFRLKNNAIISIGFDVRAMKTLKSLLDFQDWVNSRLIATLYLPYFPKWHLEVISIPIFNDHTLYNILALEGNEVRCSSSLVINCAKFLSFAYKVAFQIKIPKKICVVVGLEMFKDLKGLSELFTKEFDKTRSDICTYTGLGYYNITGLPNEIKKLIFLNLKAKDFINLCQTSKELYNLIKDEAIWSHFLARDFHVVNMDGSSYHVYHNIMINQRKRISPEHSYFSGLSDEFPVQGPVFPGNFMM